jgi:hypothetical protein
LQHLAFLLQKIHKMQNTIHNAHMASVGILAAIIASLVPSEKNVRDAKELVETCALLAQELHDTNNDGGTEDEEEEDDDDTGTGTDDDSSYDGDGDNDIDE